MKFRLELPAFLVVGIVMMCRAEAAPAAAISEVRAYQVLTKEGSFFSAAPEIHVSFNLARAADVTVEVSAHRGDGEGWLLGTPRDRYLADPPHVQTLKLGHLAPGIHEAVWNGLDEKGQPLIATNLKGHWDLIGQYNANKGVMLTAEQMVTHSPINVFRFTVKAGAEQAAVNFRRATEGVGAYRQISIGDVKGLAIDEQGNFIGADPTALEAYHLDPNFQVLGYFPPKTDLFDQNSVGEAPWAFSDSHGHAIIGNGHGLFRFNVSDGKKSNWPKTPYTNGEMLGRFPGPTETDAAVKNTPGTGYGFYTYSVDPAGNIGILRGLIDLGKHTDWNTSGVPFEDIQVFDYNGVYQRTLAIPLDTYMYGPKNYNTPRQLAADGDGNFWVGGAHTILIDGKTGAEKARFKNMTTNVAVAKDGAVFGWAGDTRTVYRLHPDGTPFPFGPGAPGVKNNGESLSWGGPDSPLPPSLRQSQIDSFISGPNGEFSFSLEPAAGSADQPVLHFSADGTFLPEMLPRVDLIPSVPANIFVGNQPATFDLLIDNLTNQDGPLTMDWTLTDFFGKQTSGKTEFTIKAGSRQSCAVTIPVPEVGFYHLTGKLENTKFTFDTTLARERAHDIKPAPDSHFAGVWSLNFYLSAMVGQKKERVGTDLWQWREPVKDMVVPDIPDNPQSGFTAHRDSAAKWGVLTAEMSNYGEPWTEGYFENQIHDLSLYLQDWMQEVDLVGGKSVQHYQFWNEPNNYYHVPGDFEWDFYDLVNGDFWDVNKARDKETRSICDGNAGNFDIFTKMASDGTAIYNDAIECHYLANGDPFKFPVTLGTSEMGSQGFPESVTAAAAPLVALRDKSYPGRLILDTEEGWYTDVNLGEKAGADAVPRLMIPEIAAGIDEIYWCPMGDSGGLPDSTTCPFTDRHPSDVKVQAAFSSYATMTEMLEGAEYVGPVDLQTQATKAYLFRKGDTMIMPVWVMVGQADVTVPLGAASVTVFDIMGRKSQVKSSSPDGSIPLHLTESLQYVTFPFNAWAKAIAKAELDRQLGDLKLDNVTAISHEMETVAPTALTNLDAMNRYFHLVKAARQAAFAGEWAGSASAPETVTGLRKAILGKEGADGYLRQTRLPLNWSEQIVRVAAIQGGELEKRLWSVANDSAKAAQNLLANEAVIYPGVALNAFIGDAGEVEKIRSVPSKGPNYPFYDASFRTQLPKKAGETFELELTAWNFYRHPVQGKMAPKLPDGWSAVPLKAQDSFALDPEKFVRSTYMVTIPGDAKPGIYPIDGQTTFNGKTQPGVVPQRLQVQ